MNTLHYERKVLATCSVTSFTKEHLFRDCGLTKHNSSTRLCWLDSLKVSTQYVKMLVLNWHYILTSKSLSTTASLQEQVFTAMFVNLFKEF